MLGLMGKERENRGPDLVLWEVNANAAGNFSMLPVYRRWLGEGWNGTFLAMHRTMSSEVPWTPEMPRKLAFELNSEPEHKVETMPISTLGGGMFDTMEFPLNQSSSFHWHGKCDNAGMHSCSPVDDMIFQMVLNRAAHRQRAFRPFSSASNSLTPSLGSDMQFCLQCPAVLDFSIRPQVAPECFNTLPSVI
ncbi:hypothetical protein BCR35DRAFT_304104 [Leucosporidium creatinivorum]|uniref:Uncharacterized protein n=1 Tax=Leucosporidium creatinivorum TaxID=106004 RepID=A0A1Y2FBG7_9BASI|nr:hypothetical protein BCR35DRAFT_304104 [Leucosporidium creatinivorum]